MFLWNIPTGGENYRRQNASQTLFTCAVAGYGGPCEARPGSVLQASRQSQDHDDQQHESETAAWVVTPACAVRPCRQSSQQQQNQYNQQNCSHGGLPMRNVASCLPSANHADYVIAARNGRFAIFGWPTTHPKAAWPGFRRPFSGSEGRLKLQWESERRGAKAI